MKNDKNKETCKTFSKLIYVFFFVILKEIKQQIYDFLKNVTASANKTMDTNILSDRELTYELRLTLICNEKRKINFRFLLIGHYTIK